MPGLAVLSMRCPLILVYPGKAPGEAPQARVTAHTAQARGQGLVDFTERQPDLQQLRLLDQVTATWHDASGEESFRLESDELEVDVASETSKMTSLQILQQAGVSVLSQANMTSQLALQLLQG